MSNGPISVDNAFDPIAATAAATAAGWTEAEIEWELTQERAAVHAETGCYDEATPLWAEALYLARLNFAQNDPRLATSIANHAFALRRGGDDKMAVELFEEAVRIWKTSALWIETLRIERMARSSLFHLRMEMRHWDEYEKTARTRLHRFAEEAQTAVTALAEGSRPKTPGLSRWKAEKMPNYSDRRKLLAAALLIAPG